VSEKRLKFFAFFCIVFVLIYIVRLMHMQLNAQSAWQAQLEKIKISKSTHLASLRGRILDRKGRAIAENEACFSICMDYKLSRLADERFWIAQSLRYTDEEDRRKVRARYQQDFNSLNEAVYRLAEFKGCTCEQIIEQINTQINDPIWKLRLYLAGKRKFPNQKFEEAVPDGNERLRLASEIDIAEMHQPQPLVKLENEDQVVAAQLKFMNTDGIQIMPTDRRVYPYKNSAAQLIGWVRPWNPDDNEPNDHSLGDMVGFCGIEYVCEPVLRGRPGKIVYNIDNEIVSTTERQLGKDVTLTIDIELQQKIENLLNSPDHYKTFGSAVGIVVIDVNSTDILAMISQPDFDLNTIRQNYGKLVNLKSKPLLNRNVAETYPPGSSAKPIMLAIGMAERKITADEVISCPSYSAPVGWPNCWIYRTLHYGHDVQWAYDGGNKARNAIKGSCNIYFSHLAARIEPRVMQQWLYDFGFGQDALQTTISDRTFLQAAGNITSGRQTKDNFPQIESGERRFFGIGQGSFRATTLQVANAYAAIARNGFFKKSRIITTDPVDPGHSLNLDDYVLSTLYDGMYAVVNESGGTAAEQFAGYGLEAKRIKVYGKTGSTERPYHAWFAGFAKDWQGNAIAFAVIVEGGQHGGSDAGPIARDIVFACIDLDYLKI